MKGWMCKVNLLVECPVSCLGTEETVHGYQILSIYFEEGLGGSLKKFGAKRTQKIPSENFKFKSSFGSGGTSFPVDDGMSFSICAGIRSKDILSCRGTVQSPTADLKFVEFVADRPYKFLVQNGGERLVFSPEPGEASPTIEAKDIAIDDLQVEGLLNTIPQLRNQFDAKDAVCFLKQYYKIIDHENTVIS